MVRRMIADPKATLAGGMPHVSLARFRALMNRSNAEATSLRPFGRCDEAIVEISWYV